jgi:hypothetical protein
MTKEIRKYVEHLAEEFADGLHEGASKWEIESMLNVIVNKCTEVASAAADSQEFIFSGKGLEDFIWTGQEWGPEWTKDLTERKIQ